MSESSFNKLAGWLGVFIGVGGLAYGILFAAIVEGATGAIVNTWFLLAILGGLAATGLFVALYDRVREISPNVALWALLLGVAGGLGQMLNASVAMSYSTGATPSPAGNFEGTPDPVGILRFAVNGLALFLIAGLLTKDNRFPKRLSYLGQLGGVLLVIMYVGRLAEIIDPADRITLIPPLLYGLVVHPVFYVWVGRELLRQPISPRTP